MTVNQALDTLENAGLTGTVSLVDRYGRPVRLESGGIVSGQSVPAGTKVPADHPVTLTVRPDGKG
jgi:beta-lactam-binding protein with PASTA domain